MNPVQAQVDAYNARDVERFVACYTPDARIVDLLAGVEFAGRDAISERYGRLFADSPDLRCEILGRLQAGEWTVDEELVTRTQDSSHCLVAYHLVDGLIDRAICLTNAP
jgi:hypothetical protein